MAEFETSQEEASLDSRLDMLSADLHLRKNGFIHHRGNNFPLDDLTWFLMEKR